MIVCNLKQILKNKGITQYAIAKSTGISAHAIKNLAENKTISITFETLSKLCTELHISVGELLTNIDKR